MGFLSILNILLKTETQARNIVLQASIGLR